MTVMTRRATALTLPRSPLPTVDRLRSGAVRPAKLRHDVPDMGPVRNFGRLRRRWRHRECVDIGWSDRPRVLRWQVRSDSRKLRMDLGLALCLPRGRWL